MVCLGQGLKLLVEAIEKAGYTGKIKIGMDVAASEFCKVCVSYTSVQLPTIAADSSCLRDVHASVFREFVHAA